MFNLETALRPNVRSLTPYRSARDDYSSGILLDANENALGSCVFSELHLERYPDPHQINLRQLIGSLRNVDPSTVFCGVGSDEVLDLLVRMFCVPGKESILITPPTYGMYGVCAHINDVNVISVPLLDVSYQLDVEKLISTLKSDKSIKIVFLCSPGNPTGTLLKMADIEQILNVTEYNGIIVVDEAYIDFPIYNNAYDANRIDSTIGSLPVEQLELSAVNLINKYPNVIVSQTLSKSFGLAGIRLGFAIGNENIIKYMHRIKAPYNISSTTCDIACKALEVNGVTLMKESIQILESQKLSLINQFESGNIPYFNKVLGGSHANFILVQFGLYNNSNERVLKSKDSLDPELNKSFIQKLEPDNNLAQWIYKTLAEEYHLVVRFRGMEPNCMGCLRITIGSEKENQVLIETLIKILSNKLFKN